MVQAKLIKLWPKYGVSEHNFQCFKIVYIIDIVYYLITVYLLHIYYSGFPLRWGDQIRLRHMTSRRYLAVSHDKVSMTDNADHLTVFRLHSVIKVHVVWADGLCLFQKSVGLAMWHIFNKWYITLQCNDKSQLCTAHHIICFLLGIN